MEPQRISPVTAAKNFVQTITFNGSDANYSVQIVAQDVIVNCSTGNHNHGSSKVKLTNVVDYNWEQRYYTGHLLAVHISGKYFAYGIKARNATGKGGGMVRVATHDSRLRALIKEMNGQVQDIAFAHICNTAILACVDEEGSLFVYNVEEKGDNLICSMQLYITQTETLPNSPSLHRVVWCPYLPEDDDADDDASRLLVLTHGNKAELINVSIINSKRGVGPLSIADLTEGYLEINEHTQPIMDAAFSPDGTAVATASMDGFVKFFQIYMHEGTKPRCLHEWQPHDGKPLSCLAFLDNHNIIYSPDEQFWKFAVTGCNNNTELKIWSCESWTCLQTINFASNPTAPSLDIFLKARLDLSAGYFLLSDINNRVLYILEMYKDRNGTNAFACSVSEFLLPAPVLSFGILEASLRKFRCSNSTEDLYPCEENDDYEDGQNILATVVRMYVIQPKRLQECHIVFQPDSCKLTNEGLTTNASPLSKKIIYPEDISSITTVKTEQIVENPEKSPDISPSTSDNVASQLSQLTKILENSKLNDIQSLLIQPTQPLNLMTPDAFSSPAKIDNGDSQNNSSPIIKMTPPLPDKIPENALSATIDATDILNFQRTQKDNFASGGSSPSREVQEILSLNNTNYTSHEYYENDKTVTEIEEQNDAVNSYPSNSTVIYNEANLNADGWPDIPILKAKEILKEENRISMQECMGKLPEILNHKDTNPEIHTMQQWLATLVTMVRDQNNHLEHLQTEIKNLKKTQEQCNVPEDLENVIAKQLDLALARSHAQQTKLFDSWANSRLNKETENHESLAVNLSHVVSKQIHEKLPSAINLEMKQTVLPIVVGTFENLKHLLLEDFTQKMVSTDQMLKEHLGKFVSSKLVADSISNSVCTLLRPSIEQTYTSVVNTNLVPSFERVSNTLFQQLNETFTQGTREYTASLESHLEKTQRRNIDKGKEMITQMQGLCDMLKSSTDKFSQTLPAELNKQLITSFTTLQDKLNSNMSEIIRDQVAVAFKNHASVLEDSVLNAVRSRAVTPSPHDTQVQLAQIQQLLAQGHINTAFQQALSASDLSLVVYICERLNPQVVFSQQPCPLQQHVLLSLIQQLSADMTNQTELKTRYLEEAVLNLDPEYPVTKEHMGPVLKELLKQLAAFISANPANKIVRSMKMLQMAAQSLLKT